MGHTLRIYNKHIKKSHRNDLRGEEDENSLKNSVHEYGIPYHPYMQMCMGNCPSCKDHSDDQTLKRKKRKSEFRKELQEVLEEQIEVDEI